MNKTLKNIMVFAIGFVSGCFVTKKYLENKQVEVICEEESENVVKDINDNNDDDNDDEITMTPLFIFQFAFYYLISKRENTHMLT